MHFYGTAESELKAGGTPVTKADRASSAAVARALSIAFPQDPILCEEKSVGPARLRSTRLWIVDPLDGTKEFLARNGEFSVMVGLAVDERPVVGVVFLPATEALYMASAGNGAWQEVDGIRTALRCDARSKGLRIVTSRSHSDSTVESLCAALPITERRASGSVGIKCSLIAIGECDIYAHPVPYMGEWDTCAPEVILREAGGTVTDCTGQPLRYNKPVPRQPQGILACAPGLHERVLPAVADAMRSRTQA